MSIINLCRLTPTSRHVSLSFSSFITSNVRNSNFATDAKSAEVAAAKEAEKQRIEEIKKTLTPDYIKTQQEKFISERDEYRNEIRLLRKKFHAEYLEAERLKKEKDEAERAAKIAAKEEKISNATGVTKQNNKPDWWPKKEDLMRQQAERRVLKLKRREETLKRLLEERQSREDEVSRFNEEIQAEAHLWFSPANTQNKEELQAEIKSRLEKIHPIHFPFQLPPHRSHSDYN